MSNVSTANSLLAQYIAKTPRSAALSARAREIMPSGVAHDARITDPYPVYATRAEGPRKWDVDGNCYIDYFGGHGSLLLGHNHPAMIEAVTRQLSLGTHFGACHELEIQWVDEIRGLLPSADMVRFTSSGTEATLLAVRIARAFTGRNRLVRIKGQFHGWNDHMTMGVSSHFDGTPTPGVVEGVAANVLLVPAGDKAALARAFDRGDIAAAIVEPTGSYFGRIPISDDFLHELRRLTTASSSLLIFDEVVTGFRVASGGYQSVVGIDPDLTTLAKILAGGLPGGAVTGRRDVLEVMDVKSAGALGRERVAHPGTYNANPLSAAAGVATLREVAGSDACERASRTAGHLRRRLNELFEAEGVSWAAYGRFSGFHIFTNPRGRPITPTNFDPSGVGEDLLGPSSTPSLLAAIRMGLLANGVDINGQGSGFVSATHGDEDVEATVTAFRTLLRGLRDAGVLS